MDSALTNPLEASREAPSAGMPEPLQPMISVTSSRDDDSDVLRRFGSGFVLLTDGRSGVSKIGDSPRSILEIVESNARGDRAKKGIKSLGYSGRSGSKIG